VKTHRLQVVPKPAEVHARARQELRQFAQFLATQNPELLAADVTAVDETLKTCAQIDVWFRRYVAALRQVQPQ
jgi:hypothetical protein